MGLTGMMMRAILGARFLERSRQRAAEGDGPTGELPHDPADLAHDQPPAGFGRVLLTLQGRTAK